MQTCHNIVELFSGLAYLPSLLDDSYGVPREFAEKGCYAVCGSIAVLGIGLTEEAAQEHFQDVLKRLAPEVLDRLDRQGFLTPQAIRRVLPARPNVYTVAVDLEGDEGLQLDEVEDVIEAPSLLEAVKKYVSTRNNYTGDILVRSDMDMAFCTYSQVMTTEGLYIYPKDDYLTLILLFTPLGGEASVTHMSSSESIWEFCKAYAEQAARQGTTLTVEDLEKAIPLRLEVPTGTFRVQFFPR